MLKRLNSELLSSKAARIALAVVVLSGLFTYVAMWVGVVLLSQPRLISSGAWLPRVVLPDAVLFVLIVCLLFDAVRSANRWTRSALIFFIVPLVLAGPGVIPSTLVVETGPWSLATWVAVLIPNLLLIAILGAAPAAIYLWVSGRKTSS